jgi:gliding motility-associated-like protein
MKYCLSIVLLLIVRLGYSQSQVCPLNIDWSTGTLTHWLAYTGNNVGGNGPGAIKQVYDSIWPVPSGTFGATEIHDYKRNDTFGIKIITSNYIDWLGGFPAIPSIGGYQYTQSIRLGSSIVDQGEQQGGYVRGLGMTFDVPPGPSTVPYTLTYAYALIMNDGYHPNNEQPLFSVTLKAGDTVVHCASPVHYIPTTNGGNLDTPNAKLQGFYESPSRPDGTIWAKAWTEVTIDLAPYRGQQVSLIFETDNCVPGGHFAYSFVAVRSNCAVGVAAPVISGDTVVCSDMPVAYSAPYLEGETFQWVVPPGWAVLSGGANTNVQVQTGTTSGTIVLNAQYSCANLQSTLNVVTTPPTVAGPVTGGTEVCAGMSSVTLTSAGNQGSVLEWLATKDGVNYTTLSDTTLQYTVQNLDSTTTYRALIRNGPTCAVDTSSGATVLVDPVTVGGKLSPSDLQYCQGQHIDATLTLTGQTGEPVNWQESPDDVHWAGVAPMDTTAAYNLNNMMAPAFYRVLVQSGVCPADTSTTVAVNYVDVPFPHASYAPADTLICYGANAPLRAEIGIGTNYAWTNARTLMDPGSGTVDGLPDLLQPVAAPKQTTDYVLSIENAGCPNILLDTFVVGVLAPITVNAGHDTSVVVGQPLQLSAGLVDTAATSGGDSFTWVPGTGLNNPSIANPVGTYSVQDSIRYLVTATAADGCSASASLLVKVYGTGAGIFVPNAFTPGGGANNVFRPIAIGVTGLTYFRVYNRWGQLVYETTALGAGWDGRIDGQLAEAGAYIWIVQGKTYTGQVISHQGTMILIR